MAKSKKGGGEIVEGFPQPNLGCCRIDALVTVDGRGQIVLPKDLRQKAGIEAGDKLAVISMEQEGRFCCMTLVKADDFAGTVKNMLGPIMKDILE
jgi:antitoxin PrlF